MAVEPGPRQILKPPSRGVFGRIWPYRVKHRIGNNNLSEDNLAAMNAPGEQQMPRLFAEKCDGNRRAGRRTPNLAGPTVNPARYVDRDNRHVAPIERLDDGPRYAFDGTREPGAKDRIDRQLGAVE